VAPPTAANAPVARNKKSLRPPSSRVVVVIDTVSSFSKNVEFYRVFYAVAAPLIFDRLQLRDLRLLIATIIIYHGHFQALGLSRNSKLLLIVFALLDTNVQ
jgi:hypothetical protein